MEVHHESITEEVFDQIDDLCASKQESVIDEEPIIEESVRTTSSQQRQRVKNFIQDQFNEAIETHQTRNEDQVSVQRPALIDNHTQTSGGVMQAKTQTSKQLSQKSIREDVELLAIPSPKVSSNQETDTDRVKYEQSHRGSVRENQELTEVKFMDIDKDEVVLVTDQVILGTTHL